ncbi:hypothetical protein ACH4TQ_30825 [Streptomyces sp. NPDC021218]|uniref:hypothetical protein n=1 Tax=Streptomyces sp. NPDC021218 TaxID=3365119 RepID=UPI0037BA0BB7
MLTEIEVMNQHGLLERFLAPSGQLAAGGFDVGIDKSWAAGSTSRAFVRRRRLAEHHRAASSRAHHRRVPRFGVAANWAG